MNRKQLITFADATACAVQITKPCTDCPWTRTALPGWLGAMSPEEWLSAVCSEAVIDCHVFKGPECAGAAIFRANIGKRLRVGSRFRLPADVETVFATALEFMGHHEKRKS
jgi:hypothetical protein